LFARASRADSCASSLKEAEHMIREARGERDRERHSPPASTQTMHKRTCTHARANAHARTHARTHNLGKRERSLLLGGLWNLHAACRGARISRWARELDIRTLIECGLPCEQVREGEGERGKEGERE
jgi:hypothetical protein